MKLTYPVGLPHSCSSCSSSSTFLLAIIAGLYSQRNCSMDSSSVSASSPSSSSSSSSSSSASPPPSSVDGAVPSEPRGGAPAAEQAAAAARAQREQYEWPARSWARMCVGLRSALKTECSGFRFQNGGRSLRWFREHPEDFIERARLFWQAHTSFFEQHWDLVKCRRAFPLYECLEQLNNVYRERYLVYDPASRTADRSHALAMLADGNVERALRWALDPLSEMETTLFSRYGCLVRCILLALALDGEWTWLLERWQAAVESYHGESKWRTMIAASAIETGSLALVQEHWPRVQDKDRRAAEIARAIGLSGSLEVFDWLAEHGFIEDDRCDNHDWCELVLTAVFYGHVALMGDMLPRIPIAQRRFDGMDVPFVFRRACEGGRLRSVEWLVSQGKVPDGPAFGFAVARAHLPIMRFLCEHIGSINHLSLGVHVEALVSQSEPGCLSVLEYLLQNHQYTPTSKHIACAATAANVQWDVLRFLAMHALQEAWDGALADEAVRDDLDVQDLLHATSRDVRPRAGF